MGGQAGLVKEELKRICTIWQRVDASADLMSLNNATSGRLKVDLLYNHHT
jgi:hypothetical protein